MDKSILINYKNIEYILWISKDLKFCCNKKVDGCFVAGLNDKDKKIISNVIGSLCVSKDNSYFVKSSVFNSVTYNLFYDYKKCLYFTDCFDDSVNSYVNLKFNNLPLVYNSSDRNDKEKAKMFARQICRGLINFGVGLSISLLAFKLLSSFFSNPNFRDRISKSFISEVSSFDVSGELTFNELIIDNSNLVDINKFDILIDTIKQGDYDRVTFVDIKNSLENNFKVDDQFKEFFNKLDFAFEDSLEYFDSSILDKIGTLSVEYVFDSPKGSYVNGQYYPGDNKIIYYNAHDFSEVDPNTALHELGHVFQSVNTNNLCFELSNEVWTREILRIMVDKGLISSDLFNKDSRGNIVYVDGYTDKLFLYYYLIELMPGDSIKSFQWEPSDYSIVSSLADMGNAYEVGLAHEILESINDCRKIAYLTPDNENIVELKEKLNYFYNKKYGFDLDQDINLFAFDYVPTNIVDNDFNKLMIQNSEYSLENVDYYGLIRSYFTDDYNTKLYFGINDGLNKKYYEIPIDDDLIVNFSSYSKSGLEK